MPVVAAVRDDGSLQPGGAVPELEHPRARPPVLEHGRVPAAEQARRPGLRGPGTARRAERDHAGAAIAHVAVLADERIAADGGAQRGRVVAHLEHDAVARDPDRGERAAVAAVAERAAPFSALLGQGDGEPERSAGQVQHRAPGPRRSGRRGERHPREQRDHRDEGAAGDSSPPPA